MRRSPAAWLLYSPRRLLVVTGLVLALVLATLLLGHGMGSSSHRGSPRPERLTGSHVRVTSTPTPPAEERVTHRAAQAQRHVARAFLATYLGAHRSHSRLSRLRDVSTPALWKGLSMAAPGQLPSGRVQGLKRVQGGAYAGDFTAAVTGGPSLEVSVVRWKHDWRVADVRPAEDQ